MGKRHTVWLKNRDLDLLDEASSRGLTFGEFARLAMREYKSNGHHSTSNSAHVRLHPDDIEAIASRLSERLQGVAIAPVVEKEQEPDSELKGLALKMLAGDFS